MAPPQAPAGIPHRLGSVLIPERIYSGTFAFGAATIRVPLRKVGYLGKLVVRITGTVTVITATPDERPGFPWNIVSRFLLNLPDMADNYNLSGYLAKMFNLIGYNSGMGRTGYDAANPGSAFANAFHASKLIDLYPIAVAVNAWELWWDIPVWRNFRDRRGLLPMGGDDDIALEITPAALADIFDTTANVSATSLTVEVYQFSATPGIPGRVEAPNTDFAVVHEFYTTDIVNNGAVEVKIPRDGVITQIVQALWLDDDLYPPAPETLITDISLRVNRDKRLDAVPFAAYAREQSHHYMTPLPAGVIVFDSELLQNDLPFFDGPFERLPEWIHTAGVTEIVAGLTIAGATLDAAKIHTAVKRLMRRG
jgi:hypothetical protein